MKEFSVHLSHEYKATPQKVFLLFKNGTVFHLTGAEEIEFDFREAGLFKLSFKGRGIIDGTTEEIIQNEKIVLRWNVTGFGKPDEKNTKVCFNFSGDENTVLNIDHTEIKFSEASDAKQKAWTEILFALEREILTNP